MKAILKTILGVFMMVVALAMFIDYPFPAFILIISGLLVIPFTLEYLERKMNKNISPRAFWIIFFTNTFLILVGIGAADDSRDKKNNQSDTPVTDYEASPRDSVAERKAMIKAKAETSTGENFMLSAYIMENLDDPDSYEHVRTVWMDSDGKIVAYVTFRAKNRFGAKIKTTYEVIMTDDDKVESIKQVE